MPPVLMPVNHYNEIKTAGIRAWITPLLDYRVISRADIRAERVKKKAYSAAHSNQTNEQKGGKNMRINSNIYLSMCIIQAAILCMSLPKPGATYPTPRCSKCSV